MRRFSALLLAGGVTVGLLGLTAPAAQAAGPKDFTHPTSPVSIPTDTATWGVHTLTVTGLSGKITDVDVVFDTLTANLPDVDAFLESPRGKRVWLISDACSGMWVDRVTMVFDDAASGPLPTHNCSGQPSFKPTNYDGGDNATEPGKATMTLSTFNGSAPNGNWKLWIRDDNPTSWGSAERTATMNHFTVRITTDAPEVKTPDTKVSKVALKKRKAVLNLAASDSKATFEYKLKAKKGSVATWTKVKGKRLVLKKLVAGKYVVQARAVSGKDADKTPVKVVVKVKKKGAVSYKIKKNGTF